MTLVYVGQITGTRQNVGLKISLLPWAGPAAGCGAVTVLRCRFACVTVASCVASARTLWPVFVVLAMVLTYLCRLRFAKSDRALRRRPLLLRWWMRHGSVISAWPNDRTDSTRALRPVSLCCRAVSDVVGVWCDRPALLATSLTASARCADRSPAPLCAPSSFFVACQQPQFAAGNPLRWRCSCS